MTLKVLVVDDEQPARDELAYLLAQQGGVEVLGQASNGPEALDTIDDVQPDLVFLDVQMPGLTGFEVARRLRAGGLSTHIIFVTAYDQRAVEAFEVNAVDYLLKPVDPARLADALDRARRRIAAERPADGREAPSASLGADEIERVLELVSQRQVRRERLAIKVGERLLLVHAEEIVHATLSDETITVVTGQHTGVSNYRTLDELQARLDPSVFWRVHRSHLVNINKVKEIVPWFRNYILRMNDDKVTEIPVSRAQTRRLREYLRI